MSRMGSVSMHSAYSSDDDMSPVNQLSGSPGRPTEVSCPSLHMVYLFACLAEWTMEQCLGHSTITCGTQTQHNHNYVIAWKRHGRGAQSLAQSQL